MNISKELEETAIKEFDFTFGETVREFEDESTELYDYFKEEFLKGVEYGLTHHRATEKEIKEESYLRYSESATCEVNEKVLKCASYTFLYGSDWGNNLVNNVGIGKESI